MIDLARQAARRFGIGHRQHHPGNASPADRADRTEYGARSPTHRSSIGSLRQAGPRYVTDFPRPLLNTFLDVQMTREAVLARPERERGDRERNRLFSRSRANVSICWIAQPPAPRAFARRIEARGLGETSHRWGSPKRVALANAKPFSEFPVIEFPVIFRRDGDGLDIPPHGTQLLFRR